MTVTANIKKAPNFGYDVTFNARILDIWRPTHAWARRSARRKIYWYERRQYRQRTSVSRIESGA